MCSLPGKGVPHPPPPFLVDLTFSIRISDRLESNQASWARQGTQAEDGLLLQNHAIPFSFLSSFLSYSEKWKANNWSNPYVPVCFSFPSLVSLCLGTASNKLRKVSFNLSVDVSRLPGPPAKHEQSSAFLESTPGSELDLWFGSCLIVSWWPWNKMSQEAMEPDRPSLPHDIEWQKMPS